MGLKLFQLIRKRWFLLLIVLAVIIIIPLFLKAILVKKKWIKLHLEKTEISGNNTNYEKVLFYEGYHTINQKTNSSGKIKYCITYKYDLNITNLSDILQLRVGLNYPSGFILTINDKYTVKSPNLFQDTLFDNNIVLPHNYNRNNVYEYFYLIKEELQKGRNTIKYQIISDNKTEKPQIFFEALKPGLFIIPLKEWFFLVNNFKTTTLPEVSITTLKGEISDQGKIKAVLSTNFNGSKETSNIKIEIRGNTSKKFSRKSYKFVTYTDNWEKANRSFLGLPEESEWVLYVPYNDKSLIRNALTYYLSGKTGQYAPRFKFCDLYLNHEYVGVYVFIEKPKLSKNRISIGYGKKGSDAYFCEVDRSTPKLFGWFLNKYTNINVISSKHKKLSKEKTNYIYNSIEELHQAFNSKVLDYKHIDSLIDINAMIDYIIINELTKNVDAYRLSCYFTLPYHKPLKMGPVWDFDLAYGNCFYYGEDETINWTYDWTYEATAPGDTFEILNWPKIMLSDPVYKDRIRSKWMEYRQGFLSNDSIINTIDKMVKEIGNSQINNFKEFPILSEWTWPNVYNGGSHENEIFYIKSWLIKRMSWMDYCLNQKVVQKCTNKP
jgi:hypothetical protein